MVELNKGLDYVILLEESLPCLSFNYRKFVAGSASSSNRVEEGRVSVASI